MKSVNTHYVVLAVPAGTEEAGAALVRAKAVGDAFGARLVMLRSDAAGRAPGDAAEELAFGRVESATVVKRTRRWYRDVLEEDIPDERIIISR